MPRPQTGGEVEGAAGAVRGAGAAQRDRGRRAHAPRAAAAVHARGPARAAGRALRTRRLVRREPRAARQGDITSIYILHIK